MRLLKSLRQRGISGTFNKSVDFIMRRGGWCIMNRCANQTQYTIYHCCVQKTASQWFLGFWADPLFKKHYNLNYFLPKENFIPQGKILKKLNNFPWGRVITHQMESLSGIKWNGCPGWTGICMPSSIL